MKQGWEIKKLAEIGKVYNGNSINEKVKKDNYSDLEDGFPYIATKDVSYESEIDYDNGIKIPNDQRMCWEHVIVIKDGAVMPTKAEVEANSNT